MSIASALLAVQKAAPTVTKDASNSAFGKPIRYVSLDSLLEAILPALHAEGIVLVQSPSVSDGQPALTTRLVHAESDEAVESTMLLMMAKSDPQGQGSAITYARRYSLMSMLGLAGEEDDDGNRASQPRREPDGFALTSSQAITQEKNELVKILGAENARVAYNAALLNAGVHAGEVPSAEQTQMIIVALRAAAGVPV
jgi:hypothetical protein